jgi:hypothetical protein
MRYLIPLLVILMAACKTSTITTSWKDETSVAKQYKKILVLALLNEPDRALREKMEEHIVGDLKTLGYDAVCSCDEFSAKTFENMNEKQALEKLGNSGIDAVLTLVLLKKETERYYVSDKVQYTNYNVYQKEFWGYYKNTYDRVFAPGYYAEETKYFWENSFYELGGQKLLYYAQSQSLQQESAKTMAHQYGKMIVKNMLKKEVLKKNK